MLLTDSFVPMIRFPITNLLDQDECYALLLKSFHPDGLHCPNGQATIEPAVVAATGPPVVLYTDEGTAYWHIGETGVCVDGFVTASRTTTQNTQISTYP